MSRFSPGDSSKSIGFRLPVDTFQAVAAMAEDEIRSLNAMAVILLQEAIASRAAKGTRSKAGLG
jgi:hypothetical protein